MDDSVATTCSRCGADIRVMSAGLYLSLTGDDLDFTLHASDHESQLAIRSEEGAYVCPTCGKQERLPPHRNPSQRETPMFRRPSSTRLVSPTANSCIRHDCLCHVRHGRLVPAISRFTPVDL